MQRLFAGVVLAAAAWPGLVAGVTHRVPEDQPTIAAAIAIASTSDIDTVSIAAGTYRERLHIAKAVVVRGRAGAEQTTIDGEFSGNVITVVGVNRDCVIEDLTVTGGGPTSGDIVGSAFYLNLYASPTIQRCRMVGNRARAGGGMNAYVYCQPLVRDCWVAENQGGGIIVELDDPDQGPYAEFHNCVIVRNQGIAVTVHKGGRVSLRNCTIADNNADALRTREQARVQVSNCIIAHNHGSGIRREDPTVCFALQCNDVFGNGDGNYVGSNPQDSCFPGRGTGDVSVDPCFADLPGGNFHLVPTSPLCSLRVPGACGVLGAYGDPCSGPVQLCTNDVESSTWGVMKSLYR
jgi:hypothetical protein